LVFKQKRLILQKTNEDVPLIYHSDEKLFPLHKHSPWTSEWHSKTFFLPEYFNVNYLITKLLVDNALRKSSIPL